MTLAACAAGAGDRAAPAAPPISAESAANTMTVGMERRAGFLGRAETPDATAVIPPAPREGESRNDLDWAIFRETRALEGSDRWLLARADNDFTPKALLKDFSCAVGADLTPENAPALASLLGRTTIDAGAAAEGAKQVYKRPRPYLHNPGPICIDGGEGLSRSFDYPSGHSSLGWMAGLVLAELAPDRATPVLQRARAYGESRAVCGVHNMSAVEAGRTNAAGVFAALHGSTEFRAAMDKARTEIVSARASGTKPDAAACAREDALTKPLAIGVQGAAK
jgi:acid phosphatase (class A)